MPSINDKVISVGPRGPIGATGSSGTSMPEPSTGVNGRLNATWNRALPLTGGSGHLLSGGLRFGNAISPGDVPTNLSRHIDLGHGSNYGFSVTSGTLNCIAYQRHQFNSTYGYQGEIRRKAWWFAADGWRWAFNDANGDLVYYDNANNPHFGWLTDTPRVVGWENTTMGSTGAENVIQMNGRGVYYYNVGGDVFNFNWDGTVYGRVNNAVQFAFVNGCDEKLKQDIAPSTFDCLAVIRKMRFYQFRWKDYRNPRKPKSAPEAAPVIPIGFVAQRLYEDFPEAVARSRKLVDKGALSMWSGDVNTLLATLCGAIQQLDREVAALAGEP